MRLSGSFLFWSCIQRSTGLPLGHRHLEFRMLGHRDLLQDVSAFRQLLQIDHYVMRAYPSPRPSGGVCILPSLREHRQPIRKVSMQAL